MGLVAVGVRSGRPHTAKHLVEVVVGDTEVVEGSAPVVVDKVARCADGYGDEVTDAVYFRLRADDALYFLLREQRGHRTQQGDRL